jgi:DNA-binding XRE family transcriptional regulator
MSHKTVTVKGKRFVLVPEEEYREKFAGEPPLPNYPPADAAGNFPGAATMTVSIAREFILRRRVLGWSPAELAKRAGVRLQTLNRLELAEDVPSVRTVDKIDDALRAGERKAGIEPPDATS